MQDRLERGERRVASAGRRRRAGHDRRGNPRRRVARERPLAGGHLVDHGADREDVAAVVDPFAGEVLG